MALQGTSGRRTVLITGALTTPVLANRIIVADLNAGNVGNGALSAANQVGFLGVTLEATDRLGYAPIQHRDVVLITAGAGGVTAGQYVVSDATGNAVPIAAAAQNKQVVGLALTTALAGNPADVLLQPFQTALTS